MGMIDVAGLRIVYFFLSALFFLAFLYPFVIYPIILKFLPKKPYGVVDDKSLHDPTVALLFCAYNEEQSLPAKIDNVRAIKKRFPAVDVHAYTDCCSDGSVDILRAASDDVTLHEGLSRAGKAHGMRELVSASDAEILIFTDANVTVDPDSIERMVAYFSNPEIGTVAGILHYTNFDESEAARIGTLYWKLEELIKLRESQTGSTMGADGSIFAMRRSLYPSVPADLLDDMIVSMNPMFLGYRVVSAPDVHALEKASTQSGDEFRRKRRIACRAFSTHRHLAPQLRSTSALTRFKYFSHKYMRWLSAGFLLLGVIFATAGIATWIGMPAAAIVLVGGVGLLVMGHRWHLPVIAAIAEIIMSILAVGIGVVESVVGRKYQTWEPPQSRH